MGLSSDFLAEKNLCGQTILHLVSHANAIISELLRLKDFIPSIFQSDFNKYSEILIDFRYFKDQDGFDAKVNKNETLQDLDEELGKNHLEILTRFYLVFESIHKYISDLNRFLDDVEEGFYIHQNLDTIFLNDEGKQLMCEALYLYGVMLLVVEHHIEGPVREKMLVCYSRHAAQRTDSNSQLDEVCQLLRSTGYLRSQPAKRPANYPDDLFRRVAVNAAFANAVVDHLRTDDIYHQLGAQPHPDHRSTALAQQAAMLVVCLFFTPEVLHAQPAKMREMVDRFFPDNWVTSVYMGHIVHLIELWEPYKAARSALANTLQSANVRECATRHGRQTEQLVEQLGRFLKEGVVNDEFLLDSRESVLKVIRQANVTLRWMLLHTNPLSAGAESMKKCRQIREQVLADAKHRPASVFRLLLDTAELELVVRELFRWLLAERQRNWRRDRADSVDRLTELADVYSGAKPLARVEKNESLQTWLREMARQVEALDCDQGKASVWKTIQLIQALEEVQELQQLETQAPVRQFLGETRRLLRRMMLQADLQDDFLVALQLSADLSYAWTAVDSYTGHMQQAVRRDPALVGRLRATFLKLSSALDLPLMRINQARSPDLVSVSQYYSTELVSYMRHVLHVIPSTMFTLVEAIVRLQTDVILETPLRLDKSQLKEYAQLDHRFQLAKLTESVSILTEGILAMKTTLVGVVRLDPKQLLEEGVRRELIRRMSDAMHTTLVFSPKAKTGELATKLATLAESMEGLRKSFEYIQDYVRIQGLRMFREETARLVGYNIEQECNALLANRRRYVADWQSRFQSPAVPIPRPAPLDGRSVTFVGRLAREIVRITDPRATVFLATTNTWIDNKTQSSVMHLPLISELERALSTSGLAGLDTLLAFMITADLTELMAQLQRDVFRDQDSLEALAGFDHQTVAAAAAAAAAPAKVYGQPAARFAGKLWPVLMERVVRVGQLQLLRRSCALQLRSTASFASSHLYSALATLSMSVMNDESDAGGGGPERPVARPLLPELAQYLHWSGLCQPLRQIYVAVAAAEAPYAAHLVALFAVAQAHRWVYSGRAGRLVAAARRPADAVDTAPFVAGLATLLRHLGHEASRTCVRLLIQFVRWQLETSARSDDGLSQVPADCATVLVVVEQLVEWGLVTQSFTHALLDAGVWTLFKMSVP